MSKNRKDKWTRDQWASVYTAIVEIKKYLKKNHIKKKDVRARTNGWMCENTIKNRLVKTYEHNKMNRDVLELCAEIMNVSPDELCRDYKSFLPSYHPKNGKRKENRQNALDTWHDVDDEPTTEAAIAEEPQEEEPEQETLKDIIDRMGFLITELFAVWDKLKEINNDQ